MTDRPSRPTFTARPGDIERWIKSAEPGTAAAPPGRTETAAYVVIRQISGDDDGAPLRERGSSEYTARLTVDITPDLRGRIKVAAFGRGVTVADMLRTLLEQEFPPGEGGRS